LLYWLKKRHFKMKHFYFVFMFCTNI